MELLDVGVHGAAEHDATHVPLDIGDGRLRAEVGMVGLACARPRLDGRGAFEGFHIPCLVNKFANQLRNPDHLLLGIAVIFEGDLLSCDLLEGDRGGARPSEVASSQVGPCVLFNNRTPRACRNDVSFELFLLHHPTHLEGRTEGREGRRTDGSKEGRKGRRK